MLQLQDKTLGVLLFIGVQTQAENSSIYKPGKTTERTLGQNDLHCKACCGKSGGQQSNLLYVTKELDGCLELLLQHAL